MPSWKYDHVHIIKITNGPGDLTDTKGSLTTYQWFSFQNYINCFWDIVNSPSEIPGSSHTCSKTYNFSAIRVQEAKTLVIRQMKALCETHVFKGTNPAWATLLEIHGYSWKVTRAWRHTAAWSSRGGGSIEWYINNARKVPLTYS